MTKISSLTSLTGSAVDPAADLFPVVDMSEAGTARNKKITPDEVKIALDLDTSASPQFTAINLGHASDTTITRASAGVVAIEGVNIVTTAGGVTFAADIVVPDEAYDATAWDGSLEVPTKNAVRDKIESLAGGITTLDGLTDVNAPTPSNNDVLTWDSTPGEWVAAAPSGGSFTAASTTEILTGTDTTKGGTPDSIAALWEQGSDVASAGTVSLGEGGYFNITGTTTITDIDFSTDKAGRKAWVQFAGALTLTHNASTLILPTGANITTAAGDTACFVSEGSDAVRCVAYNRASGAALAGGSGGDFALISESSPSGTGTVTFSSIPATYRDLKLVVRGRGTTAATSVNVAVTVNNDTGGNYDIQRVSGTGTTASAAQAFAAANWTVGVLTAASATAGIASSIEYMIHDYRGTTFQKSGYAIVNNKTGTSSGNMNELLFGIYWRSTAAINRVDVVLASGNFDAGSVVSLYGLM